MNKWQRLSENLQHKRFDKLSVFLIEKSLSSADFSIVSRTTPSALVKYIVSHSKELGHGRPIRLTLQGAREIIRIAKQIEQEPSSNKEQPPKHATRKVSPRQQKEDRLPRSTDEVNRKLLRQIVGTVQASSGRKLSGILVVAYDRGLRKRTILGRGTTSSDGQFFIEYTSAARRDALSESADIQIEVLNNNGSSIALSKTHYRTKSNVRINITIDDFSVDALSEFERLEKGLTDYLEGVSLHHLSVDDVDFIAKKTYCPQQHLRHYLAAHKRSNDSGLPTWFFYVLARRRIASSDAALSGMQRDRLDKLVQEALEKRIGPSLTDSEFSRFTQRLNQTIATHRLTLTVADSPLRLDEFLELVGVSGKGQLALALALNGREAVSVDRLRSTIAKVKIADRLKRRSSLILDSASLHNFNPKLLGFILAEARVQSPQDLAKIDQASIAKTLIERDSSNNKRANERLAKEFSERIAVAFPTTSAISVLSSHPKMPNRPAARLLKTILEKDSDLDLNAINVDRYMQNNHRKLGIAKAKVRETVDELAKIQRVYRLASHGDTMAALLIADIDSAQSIIKLGRSPFVSKFSQDGIMKAAVAEEVYAKAEAAVSKALTVYTRFSPAFNKVLPTPFARPDDSELLRQIPDYETLFGSLDQCACNPCQSIYSLSAYLVDLIAFLENPAMNAGARNALDALKKVALNTSQDVPRRPDIPEIELSCENAETPLPFIDLVLEILENAVSPTGTSVPQTTHATEELLLQPEHVNLAAYETLANAVFPLSLPFDFLGKQIHAYLVQLGTSQRELEELLHPMMPPPNSSIDNQPHDLSRISALQDVDIAGLELGLSKNESKIVRGQSLQPPQFASKMWGYGPGNTVPTWYQRLARVSVFLNRSQLEYNDLLRLLRLKSFNSDGDIRLQFDNPEICNPDNIHIENLDQVALGFLHRFLRLQRRVGWSLLEMDQALIALSTNAQQSRPVIDDNTLVRISHVTRLQKKYGLPLMQLLSWWSDIETADYNNQNLPPVISLYESLFLVGRHGDPAVHYFALNANRSELANTNRIFDADVLPFIARAFGITEPDLRVLVKDLNPNGDQPYALNLANLSEVYRHSILAKALKFDLLTYIKTKNCIGFDPFEAVQGVLNTTQTKRFIDRVESIEPLSFSIDELSYLLKPVDLEQETIAPSRSFFEGLLVELQALLETDDGDNADAAQLIQSTIVSRLSEQLDIDKGSAEFVMDELITVPHETPGTLSSGIEYIFGVLPSVDSNSDNLGLTHSDYENSIWVLVHLHKIALLVERLGLGAADLQWLLDRSPNRGWLNLRSLPVTVNDTPASFDAWLRLSDLFRFRDSLASHHAEQFFDLFKIGEDYVSGTQPFANNERRQFIELLTELTGWQEENVSLFVGRWDIGAISAGGGGMLQAVFPRDFVDERLLLRLQTANSLLRRLDITATVAEGWLGTASGSFQHRTGVLSRINAVLGSRTDTNRMTSVFRSVRDSIREQQRNALVAYLLHQRGLNNPSALYDHFLIDTEMSACQLTTRIAQAVNSVQLFVQRIFMNLEGSDIVLTEEAAEQWQWMRNFRVWEANRKIFLYPENWLIPETRDDKTPFYKDLENELLQNDITDETAEQALLNYLEKLRDVSRLQVCGSYLENETDTLHVFARTRETPHQYFYRHAKLQRTYFPSAKATVGVPSQVLQWSPWEITSQVLQWSPWENVDLDIEGDHLIPIVYNRRIYLFWAIFSEEDEEPFANLMREFGRFFNRLSEIQQVVLSLMAQLHNGILNVGIGIAEASEELLKDVISRVTSLFNELIEWASFGLFDSGEGPTIFTQDASRGAVSLGGVVENLRNGLLSTNSESDFSDLLDELLSSVSDAQQTLISLLPAKHRRIQLAWSEYKNQRWSAKKTSTGQVVYRDVLSALLEMMPDTPLSSSVSAKRLFTFRGEITPTHELRVRCYVAIPSQNLMELNLDDQNIVDASRPLEIGRFNFNSCTGKLLAQDIEERINLYDLLIASIDAAEDTAKNAIHQLTGSPQFQPGEPVTPDDDKDTASDFRQLLDSRSPDNPVLPRHYVNGTEDVYRLRALHQYQPAAEYLTAGGFFYEDRARVFFCHLNVNKKPSHFGFDGFQFVSFYHPYACAFVENVNRFGVEGLLRQRYLMDSENRLIPDLQGETLQLALKDSDYFKPPEYAPIDLVNPVKPIEDVDFSQAGAYSQYNWELFFHIPFAVACRLNANQKFEQAQKWFHYIFDPTDSSALESPMKFWRTRPFVETSSENYDAEQIDQLLRLLSDDSDDEQHIALEAAVQAWRENAFKPFVVARQRTTAFQKAVVMKYIDNLLDWGDMLFRRETFESMNEATQLYVLAAQLLGPKPTHIPKQSRRVDKTFNDLVVHDGLSNALMQLETRLSSQADQSQTFSEIKNKLGVLNPKDGGWRFLIKSPSFISVTTETPYFCVPPNEQFLNYWDRVADRLFKIRHCMDIEGRRRQLPLFGPPIDPEILVRATAAGVDIDSVLDDLLAPLGHYRFSFLLQKSLELANEVKALGSSLLSALEKRDAEQLAMLRQNQEVELLERVKELKRQQIEEAEHQVAALNHSRDAISYRRGHYQNLVAEFMSPEESAHALLMTVSVILQAFQAGISWGAVAANLIPNIKGGFVTTLGVTYGGDNTGPAASNAASAIGAIASTLSSVGGLISTIGSYQRRAQDWSLQIGLADIELEANNKQVAAAEVRKQIAEKDLQNHDLQIVHSLNVHDHLTSKFSNAELYDWMVKETSTIYFQTYQLALDMARQCERAFRYETGQPDTSYIKSTNWDSLKKGLLAGEHLTLQLRRLEIAYQNQNKREFELTKHISLAHVQPEQLLLLKQTGRCTVTLDEKLFDADYPGHYFRRVKSLALSIPCIRGPYTNINCTLRQVFNRIRVSEQPDDNDERFIQRNSAVSSIATSHANNDAGLFELNFRDERYLPFEGAGVISTWEIELAPINNRFDFQTISDVIFHANYTARDGGQGLADKARSELLAEPVGTTQLLSGRHDLSDAWYRFLNLHTPTSFQILDIDIHNRLPHNTTAIKTVAVFMLPKHSIQSAAGFSIDIARISEDGSIQGNPASLVMSFASNMFQGTSQFSFNEPSKLRLTIDANQLPAVLQSIDSVDGNNVQRLNVDEIQDVFVLIDYE